MRAASWPDSLIGGMPGGHGWPPRAGSGASPVGICRSAGLTAGWLTGTGVSWPAGGAAGRTSALEGAAWMAAVLSWARAVRAVCLLIAFQVRAWDWSQPRASFPVLKVVSVGHC